MTNKKQLNLRKQQAYYSVPENKPQNRLHKVVT